VCECHPHTVETTGSNPVPPIGPTSRSITTFSFRLDSAATGTSAKGVRWTSNAPPTAPDRVLGRRRTTSRFADRHYLGSDACDPTETIDLLVRVWRQLSAREQNKRLRVWRSANKSRSSSLTKTVSGAPSPRLSFLTAARRIVKWSGSGGRGGMSSMPPATSC
jgi:hypothetical protein